MSYVKNNERNGKINRRVFCKEKASLFKKYSASYPDRGLFVLFNEWAETNDIYGIDRHEIWRRSRKLRKPEPIIIKEGSEEWIRLQAVLDILSEADLKYLHELMEKKYGQGNQEKEHKTKTL